MGRMLDGALGGARRKRTDPVVPAVAQAGDDDFIGPMRPRDRIKAGLGRIGRASRNLRAKFMARREKFGGGKMGGSY